MARGVFKLTLESLIVYDEEINLARELFFFITPPPPGSRGFNLQETGELVAREIFGTVS